MDFEAVVNEVVRRVMEKIAALEAQQAQENNCQCSQTAQPAGTCQQAAAPCPQPAAPVVCEAAPVQKEITITKHVITEKNIVDAHQEKAAIVHIDAKAILTDLAKEYAAKQRITILRGDGSLNNRGSSL